MLISSSTSRFVFPLLCIVTASQSHDGTFSRNCSVHHPLHSILEHRSNNVLLSLDAKVHIPAFSPRKLDLLKTWVGGAAVPQDEDESDP